jgi:hypothetical protein
MKNKGNLLHMSDLEFKQYQQQNPQVRIAQVIPLAQEQDDDKKNKLGNQKTIVDGYKFHSLLEANRWCVLKVWQRAKLIKNLTCQHDNKKLHTWILQPAIRGKQRSIRYTDDFQYIQTDTGLLVVEDVKGFPTQEFLRTAKMFRYVYPDIHFFVNYSHTGWYVPEGKQ